MLALSFLTTSSAIPRNPQIRSRNLGEKKKCIYRVSTDVDDFTDGPLMLRTV